MLQLPLNISLDSSATLESFFVGENLELIETIGAYATNQFRVNDNHMLYICGAHSSGKSHLAQAVCRKFDQHENKTCVYLPLNNEQISYHILEGLADVDLICIDSLESIKGDLDWQIALFNLFNELKESGKTLIVFSNQSPQHLQLELADLSSRLSSMSIYKLQNVEDEQLVEFVKTSGDNIGMEINSEVANFILNRSDRSILNLNKIINTLDEQSLAHQRKITIPFVKTILNI